MYATQEIATAPSPSDSIGAERSLAGRAGLIGLFLRGERPRGGEFVRLDEVDTVLLRDMGVEVGRQWQGVGVERDLHPFHL